MRCPNCDSDVDDGWSYCPKCGIRMSSMGSFMDFPSFEGIANIIDREFERMRKMMHSHDDLMKSLQEGNTKRQGIRINVIKTPDSNPKVEVKTFGDYKDQEEDIRKRFGVDENEKNEVPRKMPEITEEPKHEIRRLENKIIINVKVPGVTDSRDFEVRQLEESIEVRAFAKEKAYFNLFPVPKGARVVNKNLDNEELIIELEI